MVLYVVSRERERERESKIFLLPSYFVDEVKDEVVQKILLESNSNKIA